MTTAKKQPKVSIIIRTKNEEQWISHCLKMVYTQTEKNIEVVVVDNNSTDNTIQLAQKYPVKLVTIDMYKPGFSINEGIRASSGEYVVCLSAHCIPKHDKWLENLLKNYENNPDSDKLAGVYGRQIPFKYSEASDKRDLLITFGLDKRVQYKDSFFHNANSLFPRKLWDEVPFDEQVTNIEDRVWGKAVINKGYHIIYEPEAEVFHCHGIHHNNSTKRCEQTVLIMEELHKDDDNVDLPVTMQPGNANVVAFIPVIGKVKNIDGINLLNRTISQVKECDYIKDIVVVSERDDVLDFVKEEGIKVVKRGEELLQKGFSVETTLQYALEEYESENKITDAVLFTNYLFPFRPKNFFNNLIYEFLYAGRDSAIAAIKDYRVYWGNQGNGYVPLSQNLDPREERDPLYQGVIGLGCVTLSQFIRSQRLLGDNVELIDVKNFHYTLKVMDSYSEKIAGFLLKEEAFSEHGENSNFSSTWDIDVSMEMSLK